MRFSTYSGPAANDGNCRRLAPEGGGNRDEQAREVLMRVRSALGSGRSGRVSHVRGRLLATR